MSEFLDFILEIINYFPKSEPLLLFPTVIAIIVGSFSYFGFFYNFYRPKLPEKTFLNFHGMIFIFGYLFTFFWFTKYLIFPILPDRVLLVSSIIMILIIFYLFDFKISLILIIIVAILSVLFGYTDYYKLVIIDKAISIITIAVTFVYITLVVLSSVRKCDVAENSLEYKSLYELEWFSKYLTLESLQEINIKSSKVSTSLISYFEKQGRIYKEIGKKIYNNIKENAEKASKIPESGQEISNTESYFVNKSKLSILKELGHLLLDLLIFGPPKLILLLILAYLNLSIKNLSLTLGILVFSSIFIALTLISMEKGISADIFRYARVIIKRDASGKGPKSMDGRIKRMDKEAVQLLVKHPDKSIHLEYIPMDSIIHIELIKRPRSFGK
ncbi:hypothetical protein ANME2D_02246 [Candidatus Methanoperedens nitroreducens]|uniref:Uncharacterized protein n=1 Tax=Candidatus Methanoperedens nitratireducens TaxID=1392998 RepID=A0A062V6X1_9EURY|nr:hypothetical protein [Candidatus Methanoperedens nitroreducens]KCZ71514.1 hypothetical protein ANME2D_02246 [Candidatus Methanoperedens nitroreducens]MDJ1421143.1 hypothetical protein [Candidatus Methanoperedens sp.]